MLFVKNVLALLVSDSALGLLQKERNEKGVFEIVGVHKSIYLSFEAIPPVSFSARTVLNDSRTRTIKVFKTIAVEEVP